MMKYIQIDIPYLGRKMSIQFHKIQNYTRIEIIARIKKYYVLNIS